MSGYPRFYAFDPTSKRDWFINDITGTIAATCYLLLAELAFFMSLHHLGEMQLPAFFSFGAWLAIFIVSVVIQAFVMVFVLRLNPIVLGTHRSFRYVCKWL